MRIIIYGDSITEGCWDDKKGGWANRLKLSFGKKYLYDNFVFNYGISAYTTTHVNTCFTAFFKAVCKRQQNKYKDAIVMCMIGINDCGRDIHTGEYQVGPDEFKNNLEKISLKIKKETLIKKVIFISNINVWEKRANKYAEDFYNYNADIELYNNIIKEYCELKGFTYLDIYGKMSKSNLKYDGTHPNAAGHKKIYKIVKKYLVKNIL